jgi:hypothetical protein
MIGLGADSHNQNFPNANFSIRTFASSYTSQHTTSLKQAELLGAGTYRPTDTALHISIKVTLCFKLKQDNR